MARISDYESSGQVTDKISKVPLDPQVASAPGRMLSEVGDTIKGASDAILKVQKLSETTSAQNEHDQQLNQIESDFAKQNISQMTPDQIATMKQEYITKIDAARTKSAEKIGLPGWRNEWLKEQERNSLVSKTKVNSALLDKYVDKTKGELAAYEANHRNDYITARTQGERVNSLLNLRTKVEEAEKAGFIQPGEGEKQIQDTLKKWDIAKLNYDIREDPAGTLQQIAAGKNGLYADFPADMLAKAKVASEARVKAVSQKTNYLRKDKHEETMRTILKDALNGKDVTMQIEESINNGSLDQTNSADMNVLKKQSGFHIDKLGPEKGWGKGADYTNSYNKLLDTLTSQDVPIQDKVRALFEAKDAKKLDKGDLEKLYNMHIVPMGGEDLSMKDINSAQQPTSLDEFYEKKKKEETAASDKVRAQQTSLSSAHEVIRSNIGNSEASATMTRDLYSKLHDGQMKPEEAPAVAHKMVYDAMLKSLNITTVPKEGILVMDAHKHKRRILPDNAWRDE